MAGADSAKVLLTQNNKQKFAKFSLNNEESLSLPVISPVPGISASKRKDVFKKIISHPGDHHVRFITKNGRAHSFLWQTNREQLKKGVRWGIIKPESITGSVIFTLGQYRIAAHERIAKGLVSNTQALKLTLLDHYQERFEALQVLEALVNKDNTEEEYQAAINCYIRKLSAISQQLEAQFSHTGLQTFDTKAIQQLYEDISDDIKRANDYLHPLLGKASLRANNRARGHHSILEFVKQQMVHGLYELQGLNQDITYSKKRYFALTRGELNDYIEDAVKEIDMHRADPRNAITPAHQGSFTSDEHQLMTYDFSKEAASPEQERKTLLAISFIEGWDKVNCKRAAPIVSNGKGTEPLTVIAATQWKKHRNFKASLRSAGHYFINMLKSIFVETRPWEEETWKNSSFHLVAAQLRRLARPREPMWKRPVRLIKQLWNALVDIYNGIHDVGATLFIKMPTSLVNDWASSKALPAQKLVFQQAEQEIIAIQKEEQRRLSAILSRCGGVDELEKSLSASELTSVAYHLTPGEQNDLLSGVARGIDSFSRVFTDKLFAKNPIAGLLFTTTYALGGAAIFLPAFGSSIFGSGYVNWFTKFSYSMGSSKLAAAIAGSSTQAQLIASAYDLIIHGPGSVTSKAIQQVTEDPLTAAAYFSAAYGLGYVLANGVAGHSIPWLSETLKADLGSAPETGYPLLGAKIGITLYEALTVHPPTKYQTVKLSYNGTEIDHLIPRYLDNNKKIVDRFCLAYWLSQHATTLPKLKSRTLYDLSRHIDEICTAEEARSLKKLLYPETTPSIAFQLFSIPLIYVPGILRVLIAVALSAVAWAKGNPHPWQPIKQASMALIHKIGKDLTRIFIVVIDKTHTIFNTLSSFFKMWTYTVNMIIGRLASLANGHTGHYFHKACAATHVFFRAVGEFFYPARTLKSVVFADPIHTIKTTEDSYRKIVQSIVDENADVAKESSDVQDKPTSNLPKAKRPEVSGRSLFKQKQGQATTSPSSSTTAVTATTAAVC